MRSTGISMTEAKNKVEAYCSFAKSVSPAALIAPSATKKIGPVQIDENQQKFRINGSVPGSTEKRWTGEIYVQG